MAVEQRPGEYQFQHKQKIHLDNYQGVAKDLMELNDPVADRFMQVSDMRRDVVVVQKPQERVQDYDQLVKFRVPPANQIGRNKLVEVKKGENEWFVVVNDQDLAQNVARSGDARIKFDDQFLDAFQEEVKRGLRRCLKEEKLLNSRENDFLFMPGYIFLLADSLIPVMDFQILLNNPSKVPQATAYLLSIYVIHQVLYNSVIARDFLLRKLRLIEPSSKADHPFVKNSVSEFLLPPVPLDRLIRGTRYLKKHGSELIRKVE